MQKSAHNNCQIRLKQSHQAAISFVFAFTTILLSLLVMSTVAYAVPVNETTSKMCATGANPTAPAFLSFSKVKTPKADLSEISIITWNAHKFEDAHYFTDALEFSKVTDIFFIQEAIHSTNNQLTYSKYFPYKWTFYKSFCMKDDSATGVMTGTKFDQTSPINFVSPGTEPITFTPKVTGYSQINIPGLGLVHLLNTHALNFNFGSDFKEQVDHITKVIAQLNGPVIWAGDFNTWNPDRTAYLLARTQSIGLTHADPLHDNRNLKLDHIFVRGLKIKSAEILTKETSDHNPLRVILYGPNSYE